MSEISSQIEEEDSDSYFDIETDKIVDSVHRYSLKLKPHNLNLKLLDWKDCRVLRFQGYGHETSEEAMKILAKSMKAMKKLRQVKIKGFEWDGFTADEGLNSVGVTLKWLSCLQSISFELDRCQFGGLKSLMKGLKRLKRLQSLSFQSIESYIGNEDLELLGDALQRLTSLKSMDLNLGQCTSVSDQGMKNLSKGLKRLCNLQYLDLRFASGARVTDEGLKYLGKSLRSLRSLKSIYADFNDCSHHFTEEGLMPLFAGLQNQSSLQSLFLDFCVPFVDNAGTIDQGLKDLSQYFQNLVSLRSINLNFYGWLNVTDRGLEDLGKGLQKLSSLEYIYLQFGKCGFTDIGLRNLCVNLKELNKLKSIRLCFSSCENITDEGLEDMGESLKKLCCLKFITLNFEGCKGITDEGRKALRENLQELSSLKPVGI